MNLSKTDTIGNQNFVRKSEVSQGLSGRRGMRNRAVEHNVAAFAELSFAVRWQGMLRKG